MISYYTKNFLKNYENVLIYNISSQIFMGSKSWHVKSMNLSKFMTELNI